MLWVASTLAQLVSLYESSILKQNNRPTVSSQFYFLGVYI